MNKQSVLALLEVGAIKRVVITANGSLLYIKVHTATGDHVIETNAGKLKTWSTLDAAARWLHALGIGKVIFELTKWHPHQKGLTIK